MAFSHRFIFSYLWPGTTPRHGSILWTYKDRQKAWTKIATEQSAAADELHKNGSDSDGQIKAELLIVNVNYWNGLWINGDFGSQ